MSNNEPLPLHGSIEDVAELMQATLNDMGLPTKWVGVVIDQAGEKGVVVGPHRDVEINVGVSVDEIDYIKMIGKEPRKTWGYFVSFLSFDPGVRYHPDGSGTPPSVDVAEEHFYRNYTRAAGVALKGVLTRLVDDTIDMMFMLKDEANADHLMEAHAMLADERREREGE